LHAYDQARSSGLDLRAGEHREDPVGGTGCSAIDSLDLSVGVRRTKDRRVQRSGADIHVVEIAPAAREKRCVFETRNGTAHPGFCTLRNPGLWGGSNHGLLQSTKRQPWLSQW